MTQGSQGMQDIGRPLNSFHKTTGGLTCCDTLANTAKLVISAFTQRLVFEGPVAPTEKRLQLDQTQPEKTRKLVAVATG